MTQEQNNFLTALIADKNYLGASQYIRDLIPAAPERSAIMGSLISAIVNDLASARGDNNQERKVYLRSVLSWLLRDYPGLAPLYREQLRIAVGNRNILPDVARGVRIIGEVLNGQKDIKEEVQDASEPFDNIAKQAGDILRDGLSRASELFAGLRHNSSIEENDSDNEQDKPNDTIKL